MADIVAEAEVISGDAALARFLGMNKRQFRYLNSLGVLPTFKVRRRTFARRSSLREWLVDQEQRARAEREARAKSAAIANV